jgi:hypothetical protein
MTVKEFKEKVNRINSAVDDLEILVVAQNGLLFEPNLTLKLKNETDILNHSISNIEAIIIRY